MLENDDIQRVTSRLDEHGITVIVVSDHFRATYNYIFKFLASTEKQAVDNN